MAEGSLGRAELEGIVGPELERWGVPGVEVAVVREDEVLFAGGFGLADREKNVPVTAETIFHHGSTGKAFTGLTAATLVDEGLLEWDRPINEYVPDFRLADPVLTERVTLRDLLAHRSGMARHELMWVSNIDWDRTELVRRLRHLEPSRDLRTEFQYWNQGYAAAGHVIGVVTDSTWEEQVRLHVLEPLGMTSATTSVGEAEATGLLSRPYETHDGGTRETSYRSIDAAAPAGQLLYDARDSAKWLRFQVGAGVLDDVRLVTPATFEATRTVQIPIQLPGPVPDEPEWGPTWTGYGLGWVIGTYRDRPIIYHSGGIDGFRTDLIVLTEDRIGILVCANVGGSGLPLGLTFELTDRLLGVEPRPWLERTHDAEKQEESAKETERAKVVSGTSASHPLDDYVGEYEHPGYGVLEVTRKGNGELGFRLGAIEFAAERRHFDTWNARYDPFEMTTPMTFFTDSEGVVAEVVAELEPLGAPIRFTRRPDARLRDPAFLSRLEGSYALGDTVVDISLTPRGVLTALIPGQGTIELEPEHGTTFVPAGIPGFRLEFTVGDDGPASEVVTSSGTFTRVNGDS